MATASCLNFYLPGVYNRSFHLGYTIAEFLTSANLVHADEKRHKLYNNVTYERKSTRLRRGHAAPPGEISPAAGGHWGLADQSDRESRLWRPFSRKKQGLSAILHAAADKRRGGGAYRLTSERRVDRTAITNGRWSIADRRGASETQVRRRDHRSRRPAALWSQGLCPRQKVVCPNPRLRPALER